jgi:hypothetical protein
MLGWHLYANDFVRFNFKELNHLFWFLLHPIREHVNKVRALFLTFPPFAAHGVDSHFCTTRTPFSGQQGGTFNWPSVHYRFRLLWGCFGRLNTGFGSFQLMPEGLQLRLLLD